jgi:hypothetical protein
VGRAARNRVDDQHVGAMPQNRRSQLIPSPDRDESVLGAQDDCEMQLELAGEVSDDVH